VAVTARYTEQIVALVEADVRERLDRVAEEEGISVGQVIRESLDLGLPLREAGLDGE
jgi:hypothetical protein